MISFWDWLWVSPERIIGMCFLLATIIAIVLVYLDEKTKFKD